MRIYNRFRFIRTNSKNSNHTNSSNKGGQGNAKELMKSMLKKKSTMLFIQDNTNRHEEEKISPHNNPPEANNFNRKGTLMPEFRSSLFKNVAKTDKKKKEEVK